METYLIADLQLKYGKLQSASELLEKIVPVMEERGWKLVSAHRTLIGDVNRVIDIWQVPDANAVNEAIENAVATHPEFGGWFAELSELVVGEHLSVTAKTSYSP